MLQHVHGITGAPVASMMAIGANYRLLPDTSHAHAIDHRWLQIVAYHSERLMMKPSMDMHRAGHLSSVWATAAGIKGVAD